MNIFKRLILAIALTVGALSASAQELNITRDQAESMITMLAAEINKSMPQTIDVGVVCDEMRVDPNYMTLRFTLDSAMHTIGDLDSPENIKEIREGIFDGSDAANIMLAVIKASGRGIKFVFHGEPSQEEAEVTIPASDL